MREQTRRAWRGVAALCWAAVLWAAPAYGTASCGTPVALDGGWGATAPEAAGLDPAPLCGLSEKLDKFPQISVHAVVIVRGGKLVYETYRAGLDERWGSSLGQVSYTPEMLHDVRSISKSVTSLLFGIALDRKLVAGVGEAVLQYFPEYSALRTPKKDGILLRHF